jgi:probable phosphoglycerate mutase
MQIFGNEFYFARHGQTEYNAQGLETGLQNIPLDEMGMQQAREMAAHIATLPFASCICSPMDRAQTTAELLLASRADIIPQPIAGLEERSWGDLEGMSKYDLDNYDFPSNGVELWPAFIQRTIEALSRVDIALLSSPVFIVAHSGTFRALCEHLGVTELIKPVRNARPYHFYKIDRHWHVRDCTTL